MKGFLIAVAVFVSLLWVGYLAADIHAGYVFDNTVDSYWSLSEKASTLDQKSAYLDQYVAALDAAHLSGNGAWIMQTPDTDYGQNYTALKSLQKRMQEIKGMDVTSFAYQQAISQITAQEQGEAKNLLSVIKDVWFKTNHPIFWGPYEFFATLGGLVVAVVLWFLPFVLDFEPRRRQSRSW